MIRLCFQKSALVESQAADTNQPPVNTHQPKMIDIKLQLNYEPIYIPNYFPLLTINKNH